jgi:hypothetical protein
LADDIITLVQRAQERYCPFNIYTPGGPDSLPACLPACLL